VILKDIYKIFPEQMASIDFACHKGCATCCTHNVTMTTLEGRLLMEYLNGQGRTLPQLPEASERPPAHYTNNSLAALYISGLEPEEQEEKRTFEPCCFLDNDLCSVYKVRPFGCRSFGSIIDCAIEGSAEIDGWFISLVTVIQQLIEHMDQGGHWGNMADILEFLDNEGDEAGRLVEKRLLVNQSIPGLLVVPDDRTHVMAFGERLAEFSPEAEKLLAQVGLSRGK